MFTGAQIREARMSAGLTQAELGRRLGVSMRTIGNWERGDTAARVSDAKVRAVLGEHLGGQRVAREKDAAHPLKAISDVELLAEIARRFARASTEEQSHGAADEHHQPPINFPGRDQAVEDDPGAEQKSDIDFLSMAAMRDEQITRENDARESEWDERGEESQVGPDDD